VQSSPMKHVFLRLARNILGRDFVVGDIHGHFSSLNAALNERGFDRTRDRLISVGDLIDRGPECEAVLDWLAQPWFYAVAGNHEDYAVRHLRTGRVDRANWALNGGTWFLDLPPDRQRVIGQALAALPIAIEIQAAQGIVGVVHADCPMRDWGQLEHALETRFKRTSAACQWSRTRLRKSDASGVQGVLAVVTGHTPVDRPVQLGNVFHIDTGGWQEDGYFSFFDVDTLQTWPYGGFVEK
jgi:serine/threonine protein phosphatase 1